MLVNSPNSLTKRLAFSRRALFLSLRRILRIREQFCWNFYIPKSIHRPLSQRRRFSFEHMLAFSFLQQLIFKFLSTIWTGVFLSNARSHFEQLLFPGKGNHPTPTNLQAIFKMSLDRTSFWYDFIGKILSGHCGAHANLLHESCGCSVPRSSIQRNEIFAKCIETSLDPDSCMIVESSVRISSFKRYCQIRLSF